MWNARVQHKESWPSGRRWGAAIAAPRWRPAPVGRRDPEQPGGRRLPGTETLGPLALPAMRILMGVLFVWFGGLKMAGASPVSALVADTLPWADPQVVVPALGAVEVLLGFGLVTGRALHLVLPILAAHLAGTFLTFVMLPAVMFRDRNPLLLTTDGEFVAKNLVLIGATLVLLVHADCSRRDGARY
jgi:putative oxidoreductase